MDKTFSCSWGPLIKGSTIAVVILLVLLIILFSSLGISSLQQSTGEFLICMAVVAFAFATLLVPLFFAPRAYYVTPEAIGVSRRGRDIVVPMDDVESIDKLEKPLWKGALRLAGVGGLYGNYGLFTNRQIGMFRAYITRTDTLIIIRRKTGKPIVLSPDDPDAFIQAVHKESPAPSRRGVEHRTRQR